MGFVKNIKDTNARPVVAHRRTIGIGSFKSAIRYDRILIPLDPNCVTEKANPRKRGGKYSLFKK